MELPENIKRLLLSHIHEDRAIGIELLENKEDFKALFVNSDDAIHQSRVLILDRINTPGRPCTRIDTKNTSYWINTKLIYMWTGEDKCEWVEADKLITI